MIMSLGRHCPRMVLMAYDQHYAGSAPGRWLHLDWWKSDSIRSRDYAAGENLFGHRPVMVMIARRGEAGRFGSGE